VTNPQTLNLDDVATYLLAPSRAEAEPAFAAASQRVHQIFSDEDWIVSHQTNEFQDGARRALYRNEIQPAFRQKLVDDGIDEVGYEGLLAVAQYSSLDISLRSFDAQPRSNRGWRVRLVGYPNVQTVAVGLSSNYQGTQSQNQMGDASALIREAALNVLAGQPEQALLGEYPSATSDHWDGRGLMPNPVFTVGTLDIVDMEAQGASLRMVRNTTVKKELASFFALRGLDRHSFVQDGHARLEELRAIAVALGTET
jgi:hypothetical protein